MMVMTRGNGAERWNKGRKISWRNGSLHAEKAKAGLWHAVVCPNVTGRTKKRIAESKQARAGSLALVDYLIATSGANLYPTDVWFADVMTSFSGVTFVLFCFVFVSMLSLKALRSFVLRYAGAPIAIHVCFFSFCSFGDVAFSEYFLYHRRFLFEWKVRRTFFPSAWCFSTLWARAGFLTSAYVRIYSSVDTHPIPDPT